MSSPPVLAGATFHGRHILVATKPTDQNIATTEIFQSGTNAIPSFVDPGFFTVTVNGQNVPVIQVVTNKQALLTLGQSISPTSRVSVTYSPPTQDQADGVLQDEEGEDAAGATLDATYTAGYTTTLLSGAELGAAYGIADDEWFYGSSFGAYVSNEDGAGGQPDTPITVIATTATTFIAELRPTRFYDNPSFSPEAAPGTFSSFKYSNELGTIEFLKQGRDISVGQQLSLVDAVNPERGERFVRGKLSAMVTNEDGGSAAQKTFDVLSYQTLASSEVFWLSLNNFLYESQGVDFSQVVVGSPFEDGIFCGSGNDSVTAGGGNDEIQTGAGNDSINGGEGNDLIVGGDGAGNDSYDGGTGFDTVKYTSALAAISVDLARGKAASTAGNDSAGIGSDRLKGIEGIVAGNFADVLTGSTAANYIEGGNGNDSLNGGLGQDTLVGGSGSDTFAFNAKLGSTNTDSITDFVSGEDRIALSRKVFKKLVAGTLDPGRFVAGDSKARAMDGDDYLIFNGSQLLYDADGSGKGSAVVVATIVGTLQANDIFVTL
jgi:Ca2+-binding RTX toxin-like protein